MTVPELVQEYSNLTQEAGIQFKSVKPPSGKLQQKNGAYEVPINIAISGNYYKIVDFLQKVENGTRFAKLDKTSVSAVTSNNDTSGNLDMTAEFTVYSLKNALGVMNSSADTKTGIERTKEQDTANMSVVEKVTK